MLRYSPDQGEDRIAPPTLRLKPAELEEIHYRLSIDEPQPSNILNCPHLGYVSSQIAQILNVGPRTVTNVGNADLEGGLESALGGGASR